MILRRFTSYRLVAVAFLSCSASLYGLLIQELFQQATCRDISKYTRQNKKWREQANKEKYQSLIETECAVIMQLLRNAWTDTQGISNWKRIAFQLDGAALVIRQNNKPLADELDFLSGLALNRVYILEANAMDETIKRWKTSRIQ